MINPNTRDLGKKNMYARNWRGTYLNTAEEISKLVTKYATGTCMWAKGHRLKVNFVCANWLGLDFDDGLTLQEGLDIFQGCTHVIGTTKSHRIVKNDVIRDRFRVFLKFKETCKSVDYYEYTVKRYVDAYKADKAAIDGARFFWPCKEIISVNDDLPCIEYLVGKNPSARNKNKNNSANQKAKSNTKFKQSYIQYYLDHNQKFPNDKIIPLSAQTMLDEGCGSISRNKSSYVVAKKLIDVGFSHSEIVDLIKNSRIPRCGDHSFDNDEIEEVVTNAFTY